MGKGSVRAAIASEGYSSDDEFRLHDMHVHDHIGSNNGPLGAI